MADFWRFVWCLCYAVLEKDSKIREGGRDICGIMKREMQVSYNGYYVSFPRTRREFDSLHLHQKDKKRPFEAVFVFNEIDNTKKGGIGGFFMFARKI